MLSLTLTGPQETKAALVDDLAALPGVSRSWALQTVSDFEAWTIDHARFLAKDAGISIGPSLRASVREAVAPSLRVAVGLSLLATAVSVGALVVIRRAGRR